jgi:hypothetical protein
VPPTSTPTHTFTFNPGPYQPVVQTDFAAGAGSLWSIGPGRKGVTSLGSGRYTLATSGGQPFVRYPDGFQSLGDGEIMAVFRLSGTGRAGVMGRWTSTPDGQWSMYAFWVSSDGMLGLTRWEQGSPSEMFAPISASLINVKGDNQLVLRSDGGTISGWINGKQAFTQTDTQPLPSGNWGLYVSSEVGAGSVSGHFSQVTIYQPR